MKKFLSFMALCLVASAARASPTMFHPGSGPPNVVPTGREICWAQPADLNGMIGSSEQMLELGLETELANDFIPTDNVGSETWWGGFYNNSDPCSSGLPSPTFHIRFYDDAGCIPGATLVDIVANNITEVSVGCQDGQYPLFKWTAQVCCPSIAGNLYWFSAQMSDHRGPSQCGRLASAGITGCDTVFRSAYFGYADWTPASDVFGVAFDCSQEITCWCIGGLGACCIGHDGDCMITDEGQCVSRYGGQYLGDESTCDPVNLCLKTSDVGGAPDIARQKTTWGRIKSGYR